MTKIERVTEKISSNKKIVKSLSMIFLGESYQEHPMELK